MHNVLCLKNLEFLNVQGLDWPLNYRNDPESRRLLQILRKSSGLCKNSSNINNQNDGPIYSFILEKIEKEETGTRSYRISYKNKEFNASRNSELGKR
jgi:hypothetical protein